MPNLQTYSVNTKAFNTYKMYSEHPRNYMLSESSHVEAIHAGQLRESSNETVSKVNILPFQGHTKPHQWPPISIDARICRLIVNA